MPYIHSKVSIETTPEQRQELKTRLGQAIAVIPGKSEAWLMVNLEDNQEMYFRGEKKEAAAFINVNIYGSPDPEAFQKMTEEITKICTLSKMPVRTGDGTETISEDNNQ